MVAETFPQALRLVLIDEGGLDDDPYDHGGRTAHGIIQREYDGFRARHNLPQQDVWKITPAEYTEIYHDRYWMPWCDRLPVGLDYAFFDDCVNAGPGRAARNLQMALGVPVDGFMGDVTLGTASTDADMADLVHQYCEVRRNFYRHLAQFPRYGRGWLNRVNHVEKAALAMLVVPAHEVTRNGLSDDIKAQASAKASNPDGTIKPMVAPEKAAAGATGGGMLAEMMDKIHSTIDQLSPFQGTIQMVKYILIGVTLLGVVLTFYGFYHNAKVKSATGG